MVRQLTMLGVLLVAVVGIGWLAAASAAGADQPNQDIVNMVIEGLKDKDPEMQKGAIAIARDIPGEAITKALAQELPKLPPAAQVQVLAVLGDRGDAAALPAVLETISSPDESVRIAALKALGQLGGASHVSLLAERATTTKGEEQKTARESLYRLRGPEVDATILQGTLSAATPIKVELVTAIGERNIAGAMETLLKTAGDADRRVRLESFKALKVVAGPGDVPALVNLLLQVQAEADRPEAEKMVAAVAHKISEKDRQAAAVLAVLPNVKEIVPRASLLSLLGRIGDNSALPILQTSLTSREPAIQDAAVRALADWPTAEPLPDLLRVAQTAENRVHRVLALRGFVRMLGLDSSRSESETIDLYKKAMDLAGDAAEKKRVLSGLAATQSPAALNMAAQYLDDVTLYLEAESAAVKIAQAIYIKYPQQTIDALQKVIAGTKNDAIREQAQKIIEQAKRIDVGASADPFMGDWRGQGTSDGGQSFEFVAQVIALGDGQYRMNILKAFNERAKPLHVMEGSLQTNKYTHTADGGKYRGECTLEGESCKGWYRGDPNGQFEMNRVVRSSPTLGAKPPAGAIVLFDGTNFDKWVGLGGPKGAINIAEALGGAQNAVAYLRAQVWSAASQPATLLLGSDDGVKVWLNGKLVHANNAQRGLSLDQDKFGVTLQEGMNELLLKVTNGGGDWVAAARFVGEDGKPLVNINEISPQFASEKGSNEYLAKNDGFLTQWRIVGPFQQGDAGPEALFDVSFALEQNAAVGEWKWINANKPHDGTVNWRLADGAMEVKAGSGSVATKDKFTDFQLHVEFRTPFMPEARGQARGNSGVYLQGRYEVQVLDSFGLEGLDNECGGIYQVGAPRVNMCLPPTQWQTYDITFQAPRRDAAGNEEKDATVTVVHNGVAIHDQLVLPHPTGGALDDNTFEPGCVYLQDHGNAVQFRNIWLIETK